MSKAEAVTEKLTATQIESICNAVFGPKPRGGGGRVGRWHTMRSLATFLLVAPNHEVFMTDIIYNWSAKEGVTPSKAEELVDHLSKITTKRGGEIIKLEGDSPKIIRWVML